MFNAGNPGSPGAASALVCAEQRDRCMISDRDVWRTAHAIIKVLATITEPCGVIAGMSRGCLKPRK
jgi:hypothetical protein